MEKLAKTLKGRVSLEDEEVLFLGRVLTHLWNLALAQVQVWLEHNKTVGDGHKKVSITPITLNFWLTTVKNTVFTLEDGSTVTLKDVSVDLSRQVLKMLAGGWQSYFELRKKGDTEARPPAPKKEDWFQTMAWSSFTVLENTILVPGYQKKRIRLGLGEYLASQIKGKEVAYLTLYRNRFSGEFNLSVVVKTPAPQQIENPKVIRAIDLGAGDIAVSDSSGQEYLVPARRPDKHWMPLIAQVEQRAKRCVKGSRAYKRRMFARRTMHEKSGDQKNSYQRKLARALFSGEVEAIIIGKSKTRLGLAQSEGGTPDQHYGAQNTGYLFRQLLYIKEKAKERGVPVIELPDPQRKGELDDAQNKFFASRALLALGCKKFGIDMPESFVQNDFVFNQGKGGKKEKKVA